MTISTVDSGIRGELPMTRSTRLAAMKDGGKGIADQAEETFLVEIEGGIDGGHALFGMHHQLHAVGPLQRHDIGVGMLQQFHLQGIADHVIGGGEQGQDGGMGGGQPVAQIFVAEAPGRGRIDQNLAQHDEEHGQQQHAGRQALGRRRQTGAIGILADIADRASAEAGRGNAPAAGCRWLNSFAR